MVRRNSRQQSPGELATSASIVTTACPLRRCFVDDFAVEEDEQWATEGKELLPPASAELSSDQSLVRVVTARQDVPKRDLLEGSASWSLRDGG